MRPITLVGSALSFAAQSSILAVLSTSSRLDALADRVSGGHVNRSKLSDTVYQTAKGWVKEGFIRTNLLGVSTARLLPIIRQTAERHGKQIPRALLNEPQFPAALASRAHSAVEYTLGNNVIGTAMGWSASAAIQLSLGLVQRLTGARAAPPLATLSASLIARAMVAPNAPPAPSDLLAAADLLRRAPLPGLQPPGVLPDSMPSGAFPPAS